MVDKLSKACNSFFSEHRLLPDVILKQNLSRDVNMLKWDAAIY
jgi:hypothetical protein